jgi:SAM-dependent methyltransferase
VVQADAGWRCERESLEFPEVESIPDFVLPGRRSSVAAFLRSYTEVRKAEGWGDPGEEYYHDLPYRDRTGRQRRIWQLRARTFDALLTHLGTSTRQRVLRVLDVGAGNCWLSARLAERGHVALAVDISLDSVDGLGVCRRISSGGYASVQPVRAEFDAFPFAPASFDLIIFNASLHYSPDILKTVRDSMGLLTAGGMMYILDSPLYRDAESGRSMVRERRESVRRLHGVQIAEQHGGNFLTQETVNRLRETVRVEVLLPRYGVRWWLRPFVAHLLRRREPATFAAIVIHNSS